MCSGELNTQILCCSHAILHLKENILICACGYDVTELQFLYMDRTFHFIVRGIVTARILSKPDIAPMGICEEKLPVNAVFLSNISQNNQGRSKVHPRTDHEGP